MVISFRLLDHLPSNPCPSTFSIVIGNERTRAPGVTRESGESSWLVSLTRILVFT